MVRFLYLIYLVEWKKSHRGKGFKGCYPVCFDEWYNIEFQDMVKNPGDYRNCWYHGIIEHYHEKRSRYYGEE